MTAGCSLVLMGMSREVELLGPFTGRCENSSSREGPVAPAAFLPWSLSGCVRGSGCQNVGVIMRVRGVQIDVRRQNRGREQASVLRVSSYIPSHGGALGPIHRQVGEKLES